MSVLETLRADNPRHLFVQLDSGTIYCKNPGRDVWREYCDSKGFLRTVNRHEMTDDQIKKQERFELI